MQTMSGPRVFARCNSWFTLAVISKNRNSRLLGIVSGGMDLGDLELRGILCAEIQIIPMVIVPCLASFTAAAD